MDKQEILSTLENLLSSNSEIVAAFVYGSFLTQYFNDDSDIDIAVLAAQDFSKKSV